MKYIVIESFADYSGMVTNKIGVYNSFLEAKSEMVNEAVKNTLEFGMNPDYPELYEDYENNKIDEEKYKKELRLKYWDNTEEIRNNKDVLLRAKIDVYLESVSEIGLSYSIFPVE